MNFNIEGSTGVARMAINTPQGRRRYSFPSEILTDPNNRKWRLQLEDLYTEIERFTKFGCELSKEAKKTLDLLQARSRANYQKTVRDCGLESLTELLLKPMFMQYIEAQFRNKQTITKWNRTCDLLVAKFGEHKPVQNITSIELLGAFRELEAKYKPATLDKHLQRTKQIWKFFSDSGDLTKNPTVAVKLGYAKEDLVAHKPYIEHERFQKAAACIHSQQQKTLLYYYRYMGARQNDPKGDRWDDVDWKNHRINRSQLKGKKKKIGYCPVPPQLWDELVKWRDEVVQTTGKTTGPIFPWLFESRPANQRKYFTSRIEAHPTVEVWPYFFNSLRSSCATDIRNCKEIDGRFCEALWIGHKETTADKHYVTLRPENFSAITGVTQDEDEQDKEVA
jgi:integrase